MVRDAGARARPEETREVSVRVALRPDGGGDVEGTDRYFGAMAAAAKAALERLDASERRQAVEAMLSRSVRAASRCTDVAIGGEDDPAAPLVHPLARHRPGSRPRGGRGCRGRRAGVPRPARVAVRAGRPAPHGAPPAHGGARRRRIEIVAPEGLIARAAPARKVETPFGTFARTERAEGRTLVREDRLEVARGRIAPAQYPDFASFAAAVDAIQDDPAVFRP